MGLKTVDGYAIQGDDMHYTTCCPECDNEMEWRGYFDSTDKYVCDKCHERFYVNKIWINEKEYIQ